MAVSRMIKRGVLKKCLVGRKGRAYVIDQEIADQEWDSQVDPAQQEAAKRRREAGAVAPLKKPKKTKEKKEEKAENVDEESPFKSLMEIRQDKEYWEAKLRRLKFEEEDGKLVDIDQVKATISKLTLQTKEALLNIPEQIGPDILSLTDLVTVQARIREAINAVLEDLFNRAGKN